MPKQIIGFSSSSGLLAKAGRQMTDVRAALTKAATSKFAPGKRTRVPTGAGAEMVNAASGVPLPSGAALKDKRRIVSHSVLRDLTVADPVTWGIMAMQRRLITQTPWDIVPDINRPYTELDRWEDQSCDSVNDWGYAIDFESAVLDPAQVEFIKRELAGIIKTGAKPSRKSADNAARRKRAQIASLFMIEKRKIEQKALVNCERVRAIFQKPNNQTEKSLRALLELVVTNLQIDDAGVIIKNHDRMGRLAELWCPPGHQIMPIQYPDFTVPQPPDPAYIWKDETRVRGWYTNEQLMYIMANPQGNGYGLSPIEVLMYVITASIMGDNTMIRNLKEGAIPPGILNLKEASKTQRDVFQIELDKQINRSGGNRILVVSGVPTEDGEFQWQALPRGVDFQKLQVMQYLQLAPGIKALAFGFRAEDTGLILSDAKAENSMPSDILQELSHRRGIAGPLSLLEEYINAEIVHSEYEGTQDVAFKFDRQGGAAVNVLEQAQADSSLVAAGIESRNDVRRRRKERPIPGGNVYTIMMGNAAVQVDALEVQDGNTPADSLTGDASEAGVVPPTAKTDQEPRKRNNASDRAIKQGHASRAVAKSIIRVDDLE